MQICRLCYRAFRLQPNRAFSSGKPSTGESPLKRLLDEATSFGEAEAQDAELQWATQPYTTRPTIRTPERLAPQETTVLLFPGQGSQTVGMGRKLKDVPAAKDLYDLASSVVGWDIFKLCTEGPEEKLARHCQTAVMVTSLAALELVRDTRPSAIERVRTTAGFSLGEITALVFAGALEFEHALRLVELRSAAMEAAAKDRKGGMLTVWISADAALPRALERAREYAKAKGVEAPVCQVATYLYPQCKVVAGDEEALKYIEKSGAQYGVRRSARVQVSGAFHTALMERARHVVREAVRAGTLHAPRVRVMSGAEGRPYRDVGHIAAGLPRLTTAPLRWEQTLHAIFAREPGRAFPFTIAVGPGAAVRSTLKQVNAKAWDSSIQVDV